jgi:hypothetical protein
MEENKHIQFLDPLVSAKENRFRSLILAPGRYHGYDQIQPRTPETPSHYSFSIFHGDDTEWGAITVTDTSNVIRALGFLVSPHGVSISSSISTPSNGVSVDVPENTTDDPIFFAVVATLVWTDANPGNSVLFDVEPWVPTDLENPDLTEWEPTAATDWVIGYFRVANGNKDYSRVTYNPAPIPQFAWKGGIPGSMLPKLARRDQNNVFKGFNTFNPGDSSFTDFTYNPATETLTIGSTAASAKISYANIQTIKNIVWDCPESSILYIFFDQVIPSNLIPGGNISIDRPIPLEEGSAFILIKNQTNFVILGSFLPLVRMLSNIQIPPPPAYGVWNTWVPDTSGFPAAIDLSTFRFIWRSNGLGAIICKIYFSLNTPISSATTVTIAKTGGMNGIPVLATLIDTNYAGGGLMGPTSAAGPMPYFRIYDGEIRITFPGTSPGGLYFSSEIHVSHI